MGYKRNRDKNAEYFVHESLITLEWKIIYVTVWFNQRQTNRIYAYGHGWE